MFSNPPATHGNKVDAFVSLNVADESRPLYVGHSSSHAQTGPAVVVSVPIASFSALSTSLDGGKKVIGLWCIIMLQCRNLSEVHINVYCGGRISPGSTGRIKGLTKGPKDP